MKPLTFQSKVKYLEPSPHVDGAFDPLLVSRIVALHAYGCDHFAAVGNASHKVCTHRVPHSAPKVEGLSIVGNLLGHLKLKLTIE